MNLAAEWRAMDRAPKIRLVKGEKQRDRVLTEEEREAYLGACRQPWKDVATIMLGTGMRPGEVYALRWENVLLQETEGFINILEGKSRAARRGLVMVPIVLETFKRTYEEQGKPAEGWVFPANTKSGHTAQDSLKQAHKDAVKESKVDPFPPYTMRHTALTDLGTLGCDPFTLAKIAGHSSITITQRYCHPQEDAVKRAFALISGKNQGVTQKVVIAGGHHENEP
jgi:integrase